MGYKFWSFISDGFCEWVWRVVCPWLGSALYKIIERFSYSFGQPLRVSICLSSKRFWIDGFFDAAIASGCHPDSDILKQAMSHLNELKLLAFSEDGRHNNGQFPISEGSLSLDKIWQAADDPLKATFYLSGPAAMINTFKNTLLDRGVTPGKIRIDEWE